MARREPTEAQKAAAKETAFTCADCGETKPILGVGEIGYCGGTGYARRDNGDRVCYECCGRADQQWMHEHDRITLYLTKTDSGQWRVSNWPGSLFFHVERMTTGKHNIARTRTDVWFKPWLGDWWHGVQYGEWTQICHCRRMKHAPVGY